MHADAGPRSGRGDPPGYSGCCVAECGRLRRPVGGAHLGVRDRPPPGAQRPGGRGVAVVDGDTLLDVPDPAPQPEERALARAESAELAAAVAQLPSLHREVVTLSLVHGLAYAEIAAIVGVPEGTVKSRLNTARRLLRRLVNP
ncbi:MAG: RNA polymerase sigma factor [Dehalococcoidia bacterium]|nr:RNA polymerase sigma factor [Dehalococcoidia bacterium]